MAELEKLTVQIGADTKELQSALKKMQAELNKVSKQSAESANAINKGFSGLKTPLAGLTGLIIKLGVALGGLKLASGFIRAGAEIERSEAQMASLINSTTQFVDESGKAVNLQKNLAASLAQSQKLLSRFREDAPGLAGVTTDQLVSTAQFAVPRLGKIGISDADEQATAIEGITVALQNLGLAYNEMSIRQETVALLEGKFSDLKATFANTLAQANGGVAVFKREYEAAILAGKGAEFLNTKIAEFNAGNALTANTISNKWSNIIESFERTQQIIGGELKPAIAGLLDAGVGVFFDSFDEGGKTIARLKPEIQELSENIGKNLNAALKGLTPAIQPLLTGFLKFGEVASEVIAKIIIVATDLAKTFQAPLQEIAKYFTDTWNVASEEFNKFLVKNSEGNKQLFESFALFLARLVEGFKTAFNLITKVFDDVLQVFSGVGNILFAIFNEAFTRITTGVKLLALSFEGSGVAIKVIFFKLIEEIIKKFEPLIQILADLGIPAAKGALGAISAIKSGSALAQKELEKIKAEIANVENQQKKSSEKNAKQFATGFKQIGSGLVNGVKESYDIITEGSKKVGDASGENFTKGFKTAFDRTKKIIESDVITEPKKAQTEDPLKGLTAQSKIKPEEDEDEKKKAAKAAEKAAAKAAEIAEEKALIEIRRQELGISQQIAEIEASIAALKDTSKIENETKLKEIALDQEKANLELLKSKKGITDSEYQTQLGLIEQKRIELDANKQNLINDRERQAVQLEIKKVEIEKNAEIAKSQQLTDASIQKAKALGATEAEINNLRANGNIEVEELKIKYTAISGALLAQLETLGLTSEQIELIKQGLEQVNSTTVKSKESCGGLSDSMKSVGDAAKQAGDALASSIGGAIEQGRFDLKSFASEMLNIFLNLGQSIASSFLTAGAGGAGGGFGGFGFKDGGIVKAATGGLISGAGTGRSDSIPAMLSNKEFVVNAAATKKNLPLLEAINGNRIPRFASGGQVRIPRNTSIASSQQQPVNISITAMDGTDVQRVLSSQAGKQAISSFALQAVQRQSNKSLQRSTFER